MRSRPLQTSGIAGRVRIYENPKRSAGARDPMSAPVSCGSTGHAPRTQALFECLSLYAPGSRVPSFPGNRRRPIGQQALFARDRETKTNKGRIRPVLLTPERYFESI